MKNLPKPTFNDLPEMVGQLLEKVETLVEANLLTINAKKAHDRWMTIEELMEYVPSKPAKQTIYGWVHRQQVPFHKRGNKLLFIKSEIDSWLKSGRQPKHDFGND